MYTLRTYIAVLAARVDEATPGLVLTLPSTVGRGR